MATTTGGSTYVVSTDLVANYPTASLALANRVDVVASGGPGLVKTSGYTITVADILGGNKFLYNSASPGTFTLPTSSLVDGMVVNVAQIGAGALTVSGGTIVGTTVTTAQYQGLSFVYVATGTTWYSIAPAATAPGLAIVTPTSIANTGGTASSTNGTTVFSGVSNLIINGLFSAAAQNYRVVISMTNSISNLGTARFTTGGTANSSASYGTQEIYADGGSVSGSRVTSQTSFRWTSFIVTSGASVTSMDIFDPFGTTPTDYTSQSMRADLIYSPQAGRFSGSTSFDGLNFFPGSGTISGTIRVYSYRGA
jgi:hypothetical protein